MAGRGRSAPGTCELSKLCPGIQAVLQDVGLQQFNLGRRLGLAGERFGRDDAPQCKGEACQHLQNRRFWCRSFLEPSAFDSVCHLLPGRGVNSDRSNCQIISDVIWNHQGGMASGLAICINPATNRRQNTRPDPVPCVTRSPVLTCAGRNKSRPDPIRLPSALSFSPF